MWWVKRPLRRVTQADYRHGFKFIEKVQKLLPKTKARAAFYKDVASMPRLSKVKNRAWWAKKMSFVLNHKQLNMVRRRYA